MSGRRIVQVLGSSTGGIGTHVASVTRGLLAAGDQVTVIGPAETDTQFGFRASGARFLNIDIPAGVQPLRDAKAISELRSALLGPSGRVPDVVHAHGLRAGFVSRLSRRWGSSLVVSWHTHLDTSEAGPKSWMLRQAKRAVAVGADVSLCTDSGQVTQVLNSGGQDVRYAPAAAPSLSSPTRDAKAVKAELAAHERPVLLAVGRLHEVKRFDVLIEAAAKLSDMDTKPIVVIAGDGPMRPQLAARISQIAAPVRLLGHRDDIADLLSAADIAVITSESETRQFFAQEAMRTGKPLIATRTGGIPSLVGDAAVLTEVADIDGLETAMRELLTQAAKRDKLAEAGLKQSATWPTEAETIDCLDALYQELTGQ